ncbi:MAG: response regulator transcription factor [Planctomycetota bacterium]
MGERSTPERCEAPRLLLVEDDPEIARTAQTALGAAGMSSDTAPTLAEARRRIALRHYDAIVLDLGLPDGDGLQLADELRRGRGDEVPILVLTAQSGVRRRLDGFAHGADDYICKPFVPAELVARARAVLRRTRPDRQHLLRYAGVELDLLARVARCGDRETTLSDREAALLAYLLRHPEQPLSRETLAQEVWGLEAEMDRGVVNVYVNYLRNKLEAGDRGARLIHTVRGVGYVLSETAPD